MFLLNLYDKKAVVPLIAVVLLILVTTAGAGVVSTAVLPMIKNNLDLSRECTAAKIKINLDSGYSCLYQTERKIGVTLSNPDETVSLSGIEIYVRGDGRTDTIKIRSNLTRANEEATYLISTVIIKIEEVSIAPIVRLGSNEKICAVTARAAPPFLAQCREGAEPTGIPIGFGGNCSDGVQNGNETGIDCGIDCIIGNENLCFDGIDNDHDCLIDMNDFDCVLLIGNCSDGMKNGNETDVDCGGSGCSKCIDGKTCLVNSDCKSSYCLGGVCATPNCSDGIKNQNETGIDCGVECVVGNETNCTDGIDNDHDCLIDMNDTIDCPASACLGKPLGTDCNGTCKSCDGLGGCNYTASGFDYQNECGNANCSRVYWGWGAGALNTSCYVKAPFHNATCNGFGACENESTACTNAPQGFAFKTCGSDGCKAACPQGTYDPSYSITICYTSGQHGCPAGYACSVWSTCMLAAGNCSDGIKNGNETAIDCGGGACPRCIDGKTCLLNSDCKSSYCLGGVCATPNCSDGIKNQNETGIDCGGECRIGNESLCSDGIDNDHDCLVDAADPDCSAGECSGKLLGADCTGICKSCNGAGGCVNTSFGFDWQNECGGIVNCSTYGVWGWGAGTLNTSCYAKSLFHNATCNGFGACENQSGACADAPQGGVLAMCGSQACKKACPSGADAASYNTVAEICYTSGQQGCPLGYACNAAGGCVYSSPCGSGGVLVNGSCWYQGSTGQTCTTVCASHSGVNGTCTETDAPSCYVCKLFNVGVPCFTSNSTFYPGYSTSSARCYYRGVPAGSCGVSSWTVRRICKCNA